MAKLLQKILREETRERYDWAARAVSLAVSERLSDMQCRQYQEHDQY